MTKCGGGPITEDVTWARCLLGRTVGDLFKQGAGIVPDHLGTVGLVGGNAIHEVKKAHRVFHAFPFIHSPPASIEADKHIRRTVIIWARPAGRCAEVNGTQPVGADPARVLEISSVITIALPP